MDIAKDSVKRFHRKTFKGHKVNPPKQDNYRRDGLTNHQRVLKQRVPLTAKEQEDAS